MANLAVGHSNFWQTPGGGPPGGGVALQVLPLGMRLMSILLWFVLDSTTLVPLLWWGSHLHHPLGG